MVTMVKKHQKTFKIYKYNLQHIHSYNMDNTTVGLIIFFIIAMIVCISLAVYYGTRPIEYVTIMGEVRESHVVDNNRSAMYGSIAGSVVSLLFILYMAIPDTVEAATPPTQT